MKVKIGNRIFDSSNEPIMLILDLEDKNLISNMGDQAKFCRFPKTSIIEDINKFMADEEVRQAPLSTYSACYNKNSVQWEGNRDYNLIFIHCQQNYFNDLLKVRGHVLLNEVYDALGFLRTKEGCVVGWIFDRGDGCKGHIDFGISNTDNNEDIVLNFNVDGVIYDKI